MKKKIVTITHELCRDHFYMDGNNCPGYHAVKDCIGALTLLSVIPNLPDICIDWRWGDRIGFQHIQDIKVYLTTEEKISFMKVTSPCEVTFIIDSTLPRYFLTT